MSIRYIFGILHVHVANCMSQNCNYANCMSYMQFETEYHVHDLNFFMMALVLACWQHLQATSPAQVLAKRCSTGAAVHRCPCIPQSTRLPIQIQHAFSRPVIHIAFLVGRTRAGYDYCTTECSYCQNRHKHSAGYISTQWPPASARMN